MTGPPCTTSKSRPSIGWRFWQLVDDRRPPGVAGPRHEHRRALVGEHQPVALEGAHDRQRRAAIGRFVEARPQAPARAVGRRREVGRGAAVRGGRLVGAAGAREREAQRVADRAARGLVVAQQAGEDRQARRRRPSVVARGSALLAGEVPARRARHPPGAHATAGAADPLGVVELGQDAAAPSAARARAGRPPRRRPRSARRPAPARGRRRSRTSSRRRRCRTAAGGGAGRRVRPRTGCRRRALVDPRSRWTAVPGGLGRDQRGGVRGERRGADVAVVGRAGRQHRTAGEDRPARDHDGRRAARSAPRGMR